MIFCKLNIIKPDLLLFCSSHLDLTPSQTLPAKFSENFSTSQYCLRILPSFIVFISSNEDQELSDTKKDSISKRPDFLHSALNNLGLNYVQTRLVGMLGVEIFDSKTSEITDKKRFSITVAGKSVTVITNGGDFGLFEWFPTEIKVSKNDLSRNSRCHER